MARKSAKSAERIIRSSETGLKVSFVGRQFRAHLLLLEMGYQTKGRYKQERWKGNSVEDAEDNKKGEYYGRKRRCPFLKGSVSG
jgi:hypothetical protein